MGRDRWEVQLQRDRRRLHQLGYAQELYRGIGGFSNFAISFSVISVLTGLVILYGYGVSKAGPASIWTWVVVGFFQLIVAFALGEIASSFPLAGGVFKWARYLSTSQIGWFAGWISLIGWVACVAGIDLALGMFLASYLGMDVGSTNVLWLTGIVIAIHTMLNVFGIRIVAWLNNFSVTVHIVGVVVLGGLLLAFGRQNPVTIIFETGSAYSPTYWIGFSQALLMSAWTLTAFDASANVSEESIDPSRNVPRGMIAAVLVSFLFGGILLLSLDVALPAGLVVDENVPVAFVIIQRSLGPTVSNFALVFVLVAMFSAGLSAQTCLIRIVYAMARDGALPFSGAWKYVSTNYNVPVYSVFLAGGASYLLTIFATYLPVITSLSTLGIYLSYAMVLLAALFGPGRAVSRRGPFNLGRWSKVIRVTSLVWTLWISILMVVPPNLTTGKIFLGFLALIAVYYLAVMRRHLAHEYRALSEEELEWIESRRSIG